MLKDYTFLYIVLSRIIQLISFKAIGSVYSLEEQPCSVFRNVTGLHVSVSNSSSSISYDFSSSSNFCIVKNTNVVISSKSSSVVRIPCSHESQFNNAHPTKGIAFVNCKVSIERVDFSNCGAYLTSLPKYVTDIFNTSSAFYYTASYAAALIFVQSRVQMTEVGLVSSFGFAIIGINLDKSVINSINFTSHKSFEVRSTQNKTIGNGLLLHFLENQTVPSAYKCVEINHCIIKHNFGYNRVDTKQCISDILFNDTALPKPVLASIGITILYTQTSYEAHVMLNGLKVSRNVAIYTTSLLIIHYNTSQKDFTELNDSSFNRISVQNVAKCPESAEFSLIFCPSKNHEHHTPLLVKHTNFTSDDQAQRVINYPSLKSIVYISLPVDCIAKIKFMNVRFMKNTVNEYGACLSVNSKYSRKVTVILENVIMNDNQVTTLSNFASSSGLISLKGVTCVVNGTKEQQTQFTHNYGSVFEVIGNTDLQLYGQILFKANRASCGSAINMKRNSRLYFMDGSNVKFIDNYASLLGGAIYASVSTNQNHCAFYFQSTTSHSLFANNSAGSGGSSIYAYPVFNCYFNKSYIANSIEEYHSYFELRNVGSPLLPLSTQPVDFSIKKLWSNFAPNVYPGEEFSICLSAKDYIGRHVYAAIKIEVLPEKDEFLNDVWLLYKGKEDIIRENKNCTNLTIALHTNTEHKHKTVYRRRLMFFLPVTLRAHTVNILMHSCPYGFTLDTVTGSCTCSKALHSFSSSSTSSMLMECFIQTQTFRRFTDTHSWAGVILVGNVSKFAVSSGCPIRHCSPRANLNWFHSGSDGLTLREEPDSEIDWPVCVGGREGPLCSKCSEDLSLAFGTSECIHCSDGTIYWLFIAFTLVLGPLLIFFLFALKLTLTAGTLNGIIFYANFLDTGLLDVLSVKSGGNVKFSIERVLYGFISTLNLDYAFPICFYKEMNQLWKEALNLFFPLYMLFIVFIIIVASRCSVKVSNWTSHSSLQVLVTVVHLSFSRLLLRILVVFSWSTLHTDDGKSRVWYFDGSVPFLADQGHLCLIAVITLAVFPLVFSYLTFLLLTKHLAKCSSKCNLLFRPIYEAIHAPYRSGKEYWFVLRLMTLILGCIIWFLKPNVESIIIYIITTLILCLFLVGQTLFYPFKNRSLNLLDNWTLLNLVLAYAGVLIWRQDIETATIILMITATMIFFTLVGVLIYHFLLMTRFKSKVTKLGRNCVNSYNQLSTKLDFSCEPNEGTPLDDTAGSDCSDPSNVSCDQCREPLLEH